MLVRLERVLEWAANAIVSFSILLAGVISDELAKVTWPWIIGVVLIFAGVVFLIKRALPYIFSNFTVTLS
jgi:hypothetical protein